MIEQRLYSKYHELDDEIIKQASNNGMYLTGGTAIEIWQHYLNVDKTRKRSDNDLDFFYDLNNQQGFDNFENFLTNKGFKTKYQGRVAFYYLINNNKVEVEVETLSINNRIYLGYLTEINNIKICRPEMLYVTKYGRYKFGAISTDRRDKDKEDLKKIYKLVDKQNRLQHLIKLFIEIYKSKGLTPSDILY